MNVFYKDAKSTVSLWIPLRFLQGCRQGDPLSCYIFILCAEILSSRNRSNPKIKGIKIDDTEYKLSQFADDTSICLGSSSESLNETLTILSKFSVIPGFNVNFDKTQVIWIGKKKYSSDTIKKDGN